MSHAYTTQKSSNLSVSDLQLLRAYSYIVEGFANFTDWSLCPWPDPVTKAITATKTQYDQVSAELRYKSDGYAYYGQ